MTRDEYNAKLAELKKTDAYKKYIAGHNEEMGALNKAFPMCYDPIREAEDAEFDDD